MEKIYDLTITRPAGNDTALIKKIVPPAVKKILNDAVEKKYTNVEQVGFYEWNEKTNTGRLEMAGGEFCGNATRSTAYLLLNGNLGDIMMQVSGVSRPLLAGVKKENTAFTEIPIMKDFSCVEQISKEVTKVEIEGITHLITKRPQGTPTDLKEKAKILLTTFDLLTTRKCSGVMYLSEKENQIVMDPIVWIRDVNTLFYETACASGATAVGVWKASQNKDTQTTLALLQPSEENLYVTVNKTSKQFLSAFIEGSLTILTKEEFRYA
jgi:diaminopimelate epimerase